MRKPHKIPKMILSSLKSGGIQKKKRGEERKKKKREHKLYSGKKLITKILQASGETYAYNQILGNKPLQTLAFQLPTHYHFMFIL